VTERVRIRNVDTAFDVKRTDKDENIKEKVKGSMPTKDQLWDLDWKPTDRDLYYRLRNLHNKLTGGERHTKELAIWQLQILGDFDVENTEENFNDYYNEDRKVWAEVGTYSSQQKMDSARIAFFQDLLGVVCSKGLEFAEEWNFYHVPYGEPIHQIVFRQPTLDFISNYDSRCKLDAKKDLLREISKDRDFLLE
jgi:hypothetical protein